MAPLDLAVYVRSVTNVGPGVELAEVEVGVTGGGLRPGTLDWDMN
jgi:hypothetical protein